MIELIKKIEKDIKQMTAYKIANMLLMPSEVIDILMPVLSELKKRNCEGCKFSDKCIECIELKDKENEYQHYSIDYCSNWEAK